MTVLVTGASGRLGNTLLPILVKAGFATIAHAREASDLSGAQSLGCQIRRVDLRKTEAFAELLAGIDVVIHTAALVSFRGDKLTMFTGLNSYAPLALYQAARRSHVKRFIHVSSIAAFGAIRRKGAAELPLTESAKYNLSDLQIPYLMSKRAGDLQLQSEAQIGGPELVIVYPSIMLGPQRVTGSQERLSGAVSYHVVPRMSTVVNVVDIRDVAEAIVKAISQARSSERYLLTGENLPISRLFRSANDAQGKWLIQIPIPLMLLRAVARIVHLKDRLSNASRWTLYPALVDLLEYDWAYDSTKARAELGFTIRPLADTLRDQMTTTTAQQKVRS